MMMPSAQMLEDIRGKQGRNWEFCFVLVKFHLPITYSDEDDIAYEYEQMGYIGHKI